MNDDIYWVFEYNQIIRDDFKSSDPLDNFYPYSKSTLRKLSDLNMKLIVCATDNQIDYLKKFNINATNKYPKKGGNYKYHNDFDPNNWLKIKNELETNFFKKIENWFNNKFSWFLSPPTKLGKNKKNYTIYE